MDNNQKLALGVLAAVIVIAGAAFLLVEYRITASGQIKSINIGVYGDKYGYYTISEIEWGVLSPGDTSSALLYFLNTGNAPMNLSMTIENWVPPAAEQYMNVAWTYNGEQIEPDILTPFEVILTVHNNVTGIDSFSMDLVFMGIG